MHFDSRHVCSLPKGDISRNFKQSQRFQVKLLETYKAWDRLCAERFPLRDSECKGNRNQIRALQNPVKVTRRYHPENISDVEKGRIIHSFILACIHFTIINSSNLLCVKQCAEINEKYLAFRQQLQVRKAVLSESWQETDGTFDLGNLRSL